MDIMSKGIVKFYNVVFVVMQLKIVKHALMILYAMNVLESMCWIQMVPVFQAAEKNSGYKSINVWLVLKIVSLVLTVILAPNAH